MRDHLLRELFLSRARARKRLQEALPRGLQALLDRGDLAQRRVRALEVFDAVERRLQEQLGEARVRRELVVEHGDRERER